MTRSARARGCRAGRVPVRRRRLTCGSSLAQPHGPHRHRHPRPRRRAQRQPPHRAALGRLPARSPGTGCRSMTQWDGKPCDLLLALHARRSHASVRRVPEAISGRAARGRAHRHRPLPRPAALRARRGDSLRAGGPDHRAAGRSRCSCRNPCAGKTRVVYQSADPAVRHSPPARPLPRRGRRPPARGEGPLSRRARARASSKRGLEVVQVGDALSPAMAAEARQTDAARAALPLAGRPHAPRRRSAGSRAATCWSSARSWKAAPTSSRSGAHRHAGARLARLGQRRHAGPRLSRLFPAVRRHGHWPG